MVDETRNPRDACYDIIIGTNIIGMMWINIIFSKKAIYRDVDACPLNVYGRFQDQEAVNACYIVATEDPIL